VSCINACRLCARYLVLLAGGIGAVDLGSLYINPDGTAKLESGLTCPGCHALHKYIHSVIQLL